mgnify:CR=1 FL=1
MYTIVKSNDASLPFLVIWESGRFKRSKGKYATESEAKTRCRQLRANLNRKARHQAMLDLGMVRVRGALGGVYYE